MPTYPDNLFGGQEKPRRAAALARKRLLGVRHEAAKTPAIPRPGDDVLLRATTSIDLAVQSLSLSYTTDDWSSVSELAFTPVAQKWETAIWTWLRTWECALPPLPAGTMLRYKIAALLADGRQVWADNQAPHFNRASGFAIWYGEDETPAWSRQARVYQVFVDRFNPGAGKKWPDSADLTQPLGGKLNGVTEKLPHIAALGFNTVWLSPIFASPTHHGYDTMDYFQVEPRLGTLGDLKNLISQAHKLGLRVLLDFVANHSSDQHPALRSAAQDRQAPEVGWFQWQRWPRYRAFYNVPSMPQLDLRFGSPARAHLLEAARYWLDLGIDGYRLDYADGPEQDFWVDFRRACRAVNPECWTFGEVVRPADKQASYAGGMDGTLDFLTCQALRQAFATCEWPVSRLASYLEAYPASFPAGFSRPAFIDNHDMNRFFFTAGDDPRRLDLALSLLYLMPGPPIVYYGTEAQLSQRQSIHDSAAQGFDEARLPLAWPVPETSTARLLPQLAALRDRFPGIASAEWKTVRLDDRAGTALFDVEGPSLRWWVALNAGESPAPLPVSAAAIPVFSFCPGLPAAPPTDSLPPLSLCVWER